LRQFNERRISPGRGKQYVNPWDERYGAPGSYYYGTEPNDFLREQVGCLARSGAVLCLAEGEGRNAVFLAEQGLAVVAVDQSAVGLQKAEQLAAAKGVRISTIQADLADYRIEPGQWDGIVSIWCHLPAPLRARVHRQVVAGLKPGGVYVLEAYTPEQLRHGTGGPQTAELLMTLNELRSELQGLVLTHAVELERIVREGHAHAGLSAVVQVVGRRPR
jgi:2-polyprenyl-3-methyl-5-hydroxy-6-metoxy-1,4-benzoquinol methylase